MKGKSKYKTATEAMMHLEKSVWMSGVPESFECKNHEEALKAEKAFNSMWKQAYAEGAEAMREMAAYIAWKTCDKDVYVKQVGLEKEVAKAIRSLPLPTEGDPKGEK